MAKDYDDCGPSPKAKVIKCKSPIIARKTRACKLEKNGQTCPYVKIGKYEGQPEVQSESPTDGALGYLKIVVKNIVLNILFTIVAVVIDMLLHSAFEKNTYWFVLSKNYIFTVTYQVAIQKHPSFLHLFASASVFSWLTVALFEHSLSLESTALKDLIFEHTLNVAFLFEKFLIFRLIEIITAW